MIQTDSPHDEKSALLRKAMLLNGVDAYLIPSSDPHLSEYIPDHWLVIPWLTGFTGSAATVIVTHNFAGFWTDSRYYVQAEEQLGNSEFQLMRPKIYESSDYLEWLEENLKDGSRLAFDGRLFSKTTTEKIRKRLERKDIHIDITCDLISGIWDDRPPMPSSPAFDFPVEFCGRDRVSKIGEVRELMKSKGADYQLLTASDDIMWLLNIRGSDIRYSPLFLSFALIGEEEFRLFADRERIPEKLLADLEALKIDILPYNRTSYKLGALKEGSTVLLNPLNTSTALYDSIPAGVRVIEEISIPSALKVVKNMTETGNIGQAMLKDGVALAKFFFWFENNPGKKEISELQIAEKLLELRLQQENFIGPAFETIAAFDKHGALPHYSAASGSDARAGVDGILLVDSGGHYYEGTTDITRTIATGIPTEKQKKDFSLVLKGLISLATAKFPMGTKGCQLDILARKALWQNGLNYGHGTGHGVGFCLNVHEGPVNITPSLPADNRVSILPGMLFSNEPAIYREGEYGIRTENLMICYEDEETEFGQFLRFDTVSLCFIDKVLIDKSLLDREEIDWINSYHTEVFDKLSTYLTREERSWLEEKTSFI